MKLLCKYCIPALLIGSYTAVNAHASGYAVFTHGASALGQGNAVVAHSAGPSSVFYNPALLAKLPGTQVEAGTTMLRTSRSFISTESGDEHSADKAFFPSTFYVSHRLTDSVTAGFGAFSPFGLGSDWGRKWEGRYLGTTSRLQTQAFNPVIAYQPVRSLSVAAGFNFVLLDATLEKNLKRTVFGLPDGPDIHQRFKGDGRGYGYNIGVMYEPVERLAFGISYRSPVHVRVEGKSTTGDAPAPVQAALVSRGETRVRLPQQLTAGVACTFDVPLTVEAGIRWEGWSSFENMKISLANGNRSETPRNWRNTFSYNIGGRYHVTDSIGILAGYLHSESPVPAATFDPLIPDADANIYSIGTDFTGRHWRSALSYAFQTLEHRTKQNDIGAETGGTANGKYRTGIHIIAVSVGYNF